MHAYNHNHAGLLPLGYNRTACKVPRLVAQLQKRNRKNSTTVFHTFHFHRLHASNTEILVLRKFHDSSAPCAFNHWTTHDDADRLTICSPRSLVHSNIKRRRRRWIRTVPRSYGPSPAGAFNCRQVATRSSQHGRSRRSKESTEQRTPLHCR